MSTSTPNEYLMIFRSDEWYNRLSASELQAVWDQCNAWFDRLTAQEKVVSGRPLTRSGAVVSGPKEAVMMDGPFTESKELIGGFMILKASSLEEAIAVARTSPTLRHGVTIEVRPLAEECPMAALVRETARAEQLASA